ncbi:uncharacterized protein LOC101864060 [Aplysia californica]|uniref:Uncharacterized protein LOC101864060 n=1 Tax=Aplysia californica TaxID=6500 RepID=A0ABM0ZYE2_APLCA|nr:uncharacterized protein LOC101864060 [Aplysia californica]
MAAVTTHWLVASLTLLSTLFSADAIGCFKCTSINHKNPECEDTFNNTGKFYEEDCWASRRGRTGPFPGTQCIKMIAEDASINYTVVVRNCVVDDGGTNSETEIGRQSHCGWMRVLKYNGRRMRGCILSCDTDACNAGPQPVHRAPLSVWTMTLLTLLLATATTVSFPTPFLFI